MATVYLAEDLKHRRQVAVKVLHPELAAAIGATRFEREIEIAAKLTHPHILMLIDSGAVDGHLFYVMPFVDGESLQDRLKREQKLPLGEAVRILDQVASALSHAHAQGVIHRDVKPANILLAGDQAIVADFGIARAVQSAGASKLTGTGMAMGTPAYMSPEQAFDQETVDGRADVYAMGCVLFEMLTGSPPFESKSAIALLAKQASERAPTLRTIDPDMPLFVERALSRALAKEPAERFESPTAFVDTLHSETVGAPVGRRRIAVLPPVNIGNDPERQYLVLGLHEALISQLGRGDIAVLARTSVLQYQDSDRPAKEVCDALDVEAVVESSLFCVGDALGVQARLVDGATEENVWSGSYDGEISAVLSLYREVTASIADEIHGALGAKLVARDDRPTVDPVAYEKYMRGRVYQQSFNPADLDRALSYFDAALEIQPDYAPAHAGISLIWASKIILGMVPGDEYGPTWRETAERAIELDPSLAEAHQALAQALTWFEFDWDSDPFNPFTQMLSGIQLGLTGRHSEAIDRLGTVPPNPLRSFALSWQHFALGDLAEGLGEYRAYFEMLGDEEVAAALQDGGVLPQAAMVRGAEVLVERSNHMFVKPNNMVHLFSWGGEVDRAVEWLERSYAMKDHEIAYMSAMRTSDALSADSRFHDLLTRLGLPIRK
jgi:serine/threonine-protein kinase